MTSRKAFIEGLGGTCKNWTWSWSFVNYDKRWVIFGAWTSEQTPQGKLIFTTDWEFNDGKKNSGFQQSLSHIRLVEDEGFALFTFPMERDEAHPGTESRTAKIKSFKNTIEQNKLVRDGSKWFATRHVPDQTEGDLEGGLSSPFVEGMKTKATVNRYERDPNARAQCIAKFGFGCTVCGANLGERYGEIAHNFIHVHHLVPVSEMGGKYEVDPLRDLRPVCPNCHAIIHLRNPILSIEEARDLLIMNSKEAQQ